MRATVIDHRLEAIAGPPVAQVTAPTTIGRLPTGSSLIAVGHYLPHGEEGSYGQGLVTCFGGGVDLYAYVRDGTWGPGNARLAGRQGAMWWASISAVEPGVVTLGGRTPGSGILQFPWLGELRAVAYSRSLTDEEILAVARSLSLSLSLSG